MNKAVKVGLILAFAHLIIFGAVWGLATLNIGCSEWGCLGYIILASMPWSLLLVYLPIPTYLANAAVIIILNFLTYFIIGFILSKLFSRKPKAVTPSDNSNG